MGQPASPGDQFTGVGGGASPGSILPSSALGRGLGLEPGSWILFPLHCRSGPPRHSPGPGVGLEPGSCVPCPSTVRAPSPQSWSRVGLEPGCWVPLPLRSGPPRHSPGPGWDASLVAGSHYHFDQGPLATVLVRVGARAWLLGPFPLHTRAPWVGVPGHQLWAGEGSSLIEGACPCSIVLAALNRELSVEATY